MAGLVLGCAFLVIYLAGATALQAMFLHLAAKLLKVESAYGRAYKSTLLYLLFAVPAAIGTVGYEISKSQSESPSLSITAYLTIFISAVIAGVFSVVIIYKTPWGQSLMMFFSSVALSAIAALTLFGVILGLFRIMLGPEGFKNELQKANAELGWSEGGRGQGTEPYSLLEDVEFTEFENAVDIQVVDARDYIGKKVRVVYGPRRESIGTLKSVTGSTLIVSERIEGGRIDQPIQKSKVTTFQWIPPG